MSVYADVKSMRKYHLDTLFEDIALDVCENCELVEIESDTGACYCPAGDDWSNDECLHHDKLDELLDFLQFGVLPRIMTIV